MQYSTDNQLPMLTATTVCVSFWRNAGRLARLNQTHRHHIHNCELDLRAQNAWLDGWDYEHARLLNASGAERCKAAQARVALKRSR